MACTSSYARFNTFRKLFEEGEHDNENLEEGYKKICGSIRCNSLRDLDLRK